MGVDAGALRGHSGPVSKPNKSAAQPKEKKTPGTIMAEEARALGNKLTDAERESLMAYAMRTIYGEKRETTDARRR
jgi:hypothetical protein